MQQLPFIYSNEPGWRLLRHVSFWMLWFVFQLLLYSFSPSPALQHQLFLHRLMITLPETLMYMVPSLFLAYVLMYFVIPKFILPGKYAWATLSTIVVITLTATLSALLSVTVIDYLRHRHADELSPLIAGEAHPAFYVGTGARLAAATAAEAQEMVVEPLETFPNPFTDKLTLRFSCRQTGPVSVKIYDSKGLPTADVFAGEVQAGEIKSVEWHAGNHPQGVYMVRLATPEKVTTRKVVLVR